MSGERGGRGQELRCRLGAVTRGSVMGGVWLHGARTERGCTGVVDAAGLAGGEMNEDHLDDLWSLSQRSIEASFASLRRC